MVQCVGNVGQSPWSQLELSGQVLSLRDPAVEGSDLPRVAGRAVARPGSHRDHGSPDHGTVGVGNQQGESTFLPSTSQNVCRSAACPATSGMAFPTGSYLLETTGAFISQEDFMLSLGVFFCGGGDDFACFLFFFPPLPETPNKLGISHHGALRVLLKNTEAKKCQG